SIICTLSADPTKGVLHTLTTYLHFTPPWRNVNLLLQTTRGRRKSISACVLRPYITKSALKLKRFLLVLDIDIPVRAFHESKDREVETWLHRKPELKAICG